MGTAFTFFLWYGSDVESFPQAYSESCGSMSSVTSQFSKTFSEIRSNSWLTAVLFPFFEAFKQVVCCQPRWWFPGLHHLCPYISDTTQFCKVMDGFWNWLQKLSCCWRSEWGLSWLFWGSGDGYCRKHLLQEQESCNWLSQILGICVTWLWLCCLETLNSTKRHGQTIMLEIAWGAWNRFWQFPKSLCPFICVWNSFLQRQFSKEFSEFEEY